MADDDVAVKFGADTAGATAGIQQIRSLVQGFQSQIDSLSGTLRGFRDLIIGAFSVHELLRFVETMAELGLQTERTMAQLGTTAQQTLELSGIAKLTGTSLEGMTLGIERMSLNIQRASKDALSPGAQALKVLGLSAKDLIGLSTDQYFVKLADAVAKLEPSLNRTNAVMAIGGRGVGQMLPMLDLGAKGFTHLKEEIDKATSGLAVGWQQRASEAHASMTLLGISVTTFGQKIFDVLSPAIIKVADQLRGWIQNIDVPKIQSMLTTVAETTIKIISVVGDTVLAVLDYVQQLSGGLDQLGKKTQLILFGAAVGAAGGALAGGVGVVPGALLGGAVGALVDDIRKWWDGAAAADKAGSDSIIKMRADFAAKMETWAARIKAILSTSPDQHAGDSGRAPAAAISDPKTDIEKQRSQIAANIGLWQQWLEQEKTIYDRDANNYSITQAEKYQKTITATKDMVFAELQGLTAIRNLWPAHSKEWEDAERARVLATAKATTDMLKLNVAAFQSMRTEVAGYVGTIESSWNASLRGMLAGTTSVFSAMKKVVGDLIIYWIEQLGKKFIFEKATTLLTTALWGSSEAAKTGATVAGVAARTGAEEAGALASLATLFVTIGKSIAAAVSAVFAGVTAFFAPTLGPAAPAAGAVVAGAVAAAAVLPSFAVGAWNVPQDMQANLHRNEMVVPATFAEGIRSNGSISGAGGDTHIHLHVIDAASSMRWVKQNARALASAVNDARGLNPSLAG